MSARVYLRGVIHEEPTKMAIPTKKGGTWEFEQIVVLDDDANKVDVRLPDRRPLPKEVRDQLVRGSGGTFTCTAQTSGYASFELVGFQAGK